MYAKLGPGFVVALLLASACGGGGKVGKEAGGPLDAASAGGAGGASDGTGGEPAVAGATGKGGEGTGAGSAGAAGREVAGGAAGTSGDGPGDGGTSWLTPPRVAPALVVPSGATVKLHAQSVGAQSYTCQSVGAADAGGTTYTWVLKDADGDLLDASGVRVGTQGAGPSWTYSDGSLAKGTIVIALSAPLADAIPWQLLRVTSTTGAGLLADVTYVQQLSTVGGKAPAGGCDASSVGGETRVGFVADDYFYVGGAGTAWLTPPVVPDAISPQVGLKVKAHDHAIGHQIYGCLASGAADADTAPYAWVFKGPDALLYDETFTPVGLHGAGPRWTSSDESSVTAGELGRADAPRPGAIPWLLLEALSTSGTGVFSDVATVQQVNTAGGAVPESACDATIANTQVLVPYSADYYFFASPADGGASID